MRKYILTYVLLLVGAMSAFAVMATPEPISVLMPDGSTRLVRLCGDENASWYTTLEGTLLMRDAKGFLVEATDEYVQMHKATLRKAVSLQKAAAAARTSYVPATGHVRIPVVLLNFTDKQFVLDDVAAKFDDLYNGKGGTNPRATGSVHNYYIASSDSALSLEYDVLGPYTLSHNMAYYGANVGENYNKNASALVREAAQLAYDAGVDLSIYDNNNDGIVDNLSIVVAGYNEAEGGPEDAIWPHYSRLGQSIRVGSVSVSPYLMISELRGDRGNTQAGIGTYSHEFGHALGLPDFYNTESSGAYTLGEWSLMCSGSYNNNGCTPPTFTAFERFAMGWLTPVQLTEAQSCYLEPIETSNTAYLIAATTHNLNGTAPSPMEYFLLENRQQVGWDALAPSALVGTGMMVSHITWNDTKWTYNTFNNAAPLGFDIVEAVGSDPQFSRPSDLFPGTSNITTYTPLLNDGTLMREHQLLNIMQLDDGRISFRHGESADEGFLFSPSEAPLLTTTFDAGVRNELDTFVLTITGKQLKADSVKIYLTTSNFAFSPNNGTDWYFGTSASGEFEDAVLPDSTYSRELLVVCRPSRINCGSLKGNLVIASVDGSDINQLMLSGTAPRPTYITTPTPMGEDAMSETSFTAVWEPQDDADAYFLTLYSATDAESVVVQGFEEFSTPAERALIGWDAANIANYTASVASGKRSVLMASSDAYIVSEEYPCPPYMVSFWVSNNYTTDASGATPGGEVLLEGTSDGAHWEAIGKLSIKRTTKGLVKEYALPEESTYTRFRISYTHQAGNGGVLIDDFTADLPQTITYLYKANQYEVYGDKSRAVFSNLTAGKTYYWQVQAFEEKGCEAHYTSLSAPRAVTMADASKQRAELTITRSADGVYTLSLPLPSDGKHIVGIYAADGRMVSSVRPLYGETQVQLPTGGLQTQAVYYVKLFTGRMKRHADYGKFFFF